MSRYDVRNGRELWRGKWRGDKEILNESDRQRLDLQQAFNAVIFGMEQETGFDLYEVVPTCFRSEEMEWENKGDDAGDENAYIRLAPYIGMTMQFNSVPGLTKDSATANMVCCHPAFELARQTLTVKYRGLSLSLAPFDIQKPAASQCSFLLPAGRLQGRAPCLSIKEFFGENSYHGVIRDNQALLY